MLPSLLLRHCRRLLLEWGGHTALQLLPPLFLAAVTAAAAPLLTCALIAASVAPALLGSRRACALQKARLGWGQLTA